MDVQEKFLQFLKRTNRSTTDFTAKDRKDFHAEKEREHKK